PMPIQSYQDLEVWRKAVDLVEQVYHVTKTFPREETYGLTSQMRRAATSVPANIAEGWARRRTREFLQFLNIAARSLHRIQALSRQLLNLQRSLKQT
ncbi:MAG: four helix bundle protein, partial [Gemmatales bacterium]|nr:four helix bundle protein [Gemmatales bacterium]